MHLALLLSTGLISVLIEAFYKDDETRKKRTILCFSIFLFLFAALRSKYVGTDTYGYCVEYERVAKLSMKSVMAEHYRDPMYPIFTKLLSYISTNPQTLLAAIALIEVIGLASFANSLKKPYLFYLLFITLRMYSFTLAGLRQTIAISILMFALPLLEKKKISIFIALVFFAATFHSSALVVLLYIPLILTQHTFIWSFSAISVALIDVLSGYSLTRFFSNVLFKERYDNYIKTALATNTHLTSTFLVYFVFFIAIIVFYKQIKKEQPKISFYLKAASIGMMFSLMSQGFPNLFRIAYYFMIYLFASVPSLIESFPKSNRYVLVFAISLLLIAQYYFFGSGAGTDHYQFFWQVWKV